MNLIEFKQATKDSAYGVIEKRNHASLSQDFVDWWIPFYGMPTDYDSCDNEQFEYATRLEFALKGWNAAKGLT